MSFNKQDIRSFFTFTTPKNSPSPPNNKKKTKTPKKSSLPNKPAKSTPNQSKGDTNQSKSNKANTPIRTGVKRRLTELTLDDNDDTINVETGIESDSKLEPSAFTVDSTEPPPKKRKLWDLSAQNTAQYDSISSVLTHSDTTIDDNPLETHFTQKNITASAAAASAPAPTLSNPNKTDYITKSGITVRTPVKASSLKLNRTVSPISDCSDSSNSSSNIPSEHLMYPLPCKQRSKWNRITSVLSKKIRSDKELITALYQLTPDRRRLSCKGLGAFVTKVMSNNERSEFFNTTLPFIQKSVLSLPKLFPLSEVSLLQSGLNGSVELTEEKTTALLAMSFFGVHSWRLPTSFPRFYITNLFGSISPNNFAKLQCILHYFHRMAAYDAMQPSAEMKQIENNAFISIPTILVHRRVLSGDDLLLLRSENLLTNTTPLCDFQFHIDGTIEDCDNSIQIDFANKFIGGGVLGRGCVQEEIRFVINPQCLVSLLLCEVMHVNESIAIVGTQQFSNYVGYGQSFRYASPRNDTTPSATVAARSDIERETRVRNCIVAIDALKYPLSQSHSQFTMPKIKREFIKAYTGFSVPESITNLDIDREADGKLWIATGNWGCGVFNGDIALKLVLQWLAATLSNRKLRYYSFGDRNCEFVSSFVSIMSKRKITVAQLWSHVEKYSNYRSNVVNPKSRDVLSLFEFIVASYDGETLVSDERMNSSLDSGINESAFFWSDDSGYISSSPAPTEPTTTTTRVVPTLDSVDERKEENGNDDVEMDMNPFSSNEKSPSADKKLTDMSSDSD